MILKTLIASAACLSLFAGAAAAEPTYRFDIRKAPLEDALKQFATQTGLQVAYFTKVARGYTAPQVTGTLTAEQALQTLLQASGLRFERLDKQTVAIRGAGEPSPAAGAYRSVAAGAGEQVAMLLTGADEARISSANSREPERDATAGEEAQMTVTGSHIRGVRNDTAPVMAFDREYIERSGYSNMMQLVESLPVHFKGGSAGATEAAPFGSNASFWGQNLTRGTGFNLRGLGSVASLTLINGRRIAPSGQGQFVDVSTIPLSAVERVEILTDGASAIYGADAVSGVVNIVLRENFTGAETGLLYGSASDGSVDEQRLSQTFGHSWRSGNALLITELYRRDKLDVTDRDFIVRAGSDEGPTYLLPRRRLATSMLGIRQSLPAGLDLAVNLLYSYEEVDSARTSNNSTESQTPVTNQWSAAFGLGYEGVGNWRFTLDGLVARVEPDTGFQYTNTQTGQVTLLVDDYRDRFDTWSLDLKGDGELFALPGGAVRMAAGMSYREDDLMSARRWVIPANGWQLRASDARNVKSAFGEIHVPLVGEAQAVAWARRIELSLAARYDEYSDFGSTTNPRAGLVWSPTQNLDLRAAVSSSFRAPSVAEKALAVRGVQISTAFVDTADGSGLVPIFYLQGSAPLTAEESDNISLGFTWRPSFVEGLELTLNYFDIDYTNRITSPPFDNGALARRADFGELISDLGDDAAAQAYLNSRIAAGDLFIDWEGIGFTGVRHVFDLRQKNAARTQSSGFDLSAAYTLARAVNTFDLQLNVTRINEILTSLTRDTTTFDRVDRFNQPLDWRARGLVTWLRGGWSTTFVASYADDYINDSLLADVPVASWLTLDLNASYEIPHAGHPVFGGTRISLGVTNLLGEEPPRATPPTFAPPVGYDVFNADAMGRFVTVRLNKRW